MRERGGTPVPALTGPAATGRRAALLTAAIKAYGALWWLVWSVVIVGTSLAGMLVGGITLPFSIFLMSWVLAMCLVFRPGWEDPTGRRTASDAGHHLCLSIAFSFGAVTATAGLVGLLIAPVVVVVIATSPGALRLIMRLAKVRPARRGSDRGPDSSPAPPPPRETHGIRVTAETLRSAVATLSDVELCRAWRASYSALLSTHTPGGRAELVHVRQAFLDELDRRHPLGLRAWLDSGARAAGNPTPFIIRTNGAGNAAEPAIE